MATTSETAAITALRHIAAGHDAVCTDCGWTGTRREVYASGCQDCGDKMQLSFGADEVADYALRQIETGGEG